MENEIKCNIVHFLAQHKEHGYSARNPETAGKCAIFSFAIDTVRDDMKLFLFFAEIRFEIEPETSAPVMALHSRLRALFSFFLISKTYKSNRKRIQFPFSPFTRSGRHIIEYFISKLNEKCAFKCN